MAIAASYTNIFKIPKSFVKKKEGIVILPLEKYEEMKEIVEIFTSKKLAKDIKKAREEIKKGKVVPLKSVERELI